jgi:hypothetical protein
VIRISRGLAAGTAGSALFDGSGALLGITALSQDQGEAVFSYPMESYLQVEEQKARQAKVTTAPWEDTKPPAQLQVAAEPTVQPPKAARAQPPLPRVNADNLAYKQAVKEYLEDIVRRLDQSTWCIPIPRASRTGPGPRRSGSASTPGGARRIVRRHDERLRDRSTWRHCLPCASDQRSAGAGLDQNRGMMATVAVTFALADK